MREPRARKGKMLRKEVRDRTLGRGRREAEARAFERAKARRCPWV